MTCIFCEYEFCWHCLAYAGNDSGHFDVLNPDNCGYSMMGDHVESKCCRIIKAILWFLLFLLFMPLIAILWFPIALCSAACKVQGSDICACCTCGVFLFIIGLICVPIVAPLTLIFFFAMFFYIPISQCKKHRDGKKSKLEREQKAKERIRLILENKSRIGDHHAKI